MAADGAMSAKDESPAAIVPLPEFTGDSAVMSPDTYWAMCDRIHTLTAENAELRHDRQAGQVENERIRGLWEIADNELRSLRAAVKLWQGANGDPKAMVVAEATSIGLARSWETE